MNSIKGDFNKLEAEMKAFSEEIDKKLKDIDKKINDKNERNKKKIILLEQLKEICDMLIIDNRESEKNNMTKTIFSAIKYCLLGTITYIFTKDIGVKIILTIFKTNPVISVMLFVSAIIIGAMAFILPQYLVKKDYLKKVRKASIKKIVIDSKLKELTEK